jgi:hypothetical protein
MPTIDYRLLVRAPDIITGRHPETLTTDLMHQKQDHHVERTMSIIQL